jgi:hypothetical protein
MVIWIRGIARALDISRLHKVCRALAVDKHNVPESHSMRHQLTHGIRSAEPLSRLRVQIRSSIPDPAGAPAWHS